MFNPRPLTKKEREQVDALKKLNVKKVRKFIERGELDVNKLFSEEGRRPIHLVIPFRGPTAILEYLLERDDIQVDALDAFGSTALMCAASHGNADACRVLIQHGADYNLKGGLVKQNAVEIFKERHGHLFSSFEEIIKERENSLKAEANSEIKVIEEVPTANKASLLKQRKATQTPTHSNSTLGAQPAIDQPENVGHCNFKLGFWKLVNCFNSRHNASSDVLYVPLKNTVSASPEPPKLK